MIHGIICVTSGSYTVVMTTAQVQTSHEVVNIITWCQNDFIFYDQKQLLDVIKIKMMFCILGLD